MLTDTPLVAFAATTDLDRAHAFYGEVLGLRRVDATPFASVYDAHGTSLRVTRVERVAAAPTPSLAGTSRTSRPPWRRSQPAASPSSGSPASSRTSSACGPHPAGARIAWFRDPDANILSLAQHPPT